MKVGLFALLMMTVAFVGLSHAGKQTPPGRAVGKSIFYTDSQPQEGRVAQRRQKLPAGKDSGTPFVLRSQKIGPPPPQQEGVRTPPSGLPSPSARRPHSPPLSPQQGRKSPGSKRPFGLPSILAKLRRRQSPGLSLQQDDGTSSGQRSIDTRAQLPLPPLGDDGTSSWQRFIDTRAPAPLPEDDRASSGQRLIDSLAPAPPRSPPRSPPPPRRRPGELNYVDLDFSGRPTPGNSPKTPHKRSNYVDLRPAGQDADQDTPAYAEVRKHNDGIVYTSVTFDERTPALLPMEERKHTNYAEILPNVLRPLKCRRRRDASGSCVQDSYETEVKHVAIGNDVTGNIFVSAVIRTTGKFQIAAKCARTGKVLSRRSYFWPRIEDPHTFPALHIDGTFFGRSLVIQITMPDGGVRNFRYIPKRTLSASLQAHFNRKRSAIVGKISFSGNLVDRVYLSLYQSGPTTQLVKRFVFFAIDEPNPYALDGKFPPLVPGMTYHLAVDSFLAGRVQTLRYTVQR